MKRNGESDTPRRAGRGAGQKSDGNLETTVSKSTPSPEERQASIHAHEPFSEHVFNSEKYPRITCVQRRFGADVVLIPIKKGEKGTREKGWPDFTVDKMSDPIHLQKLECGNIGILTGPNSGNLISIDLDDDEVADTFYQANADLCDRTVSTRGARGRNYWFRIVGDYPLGPQNFGNHTGDHFGELRAGQCYTLVEGVHPSGSCYSAEGNTVTTCSFADIVWPEEWKLPWNTDPFDDLISKEGHPFTQGERGGITLNEPSIVEKFATEHLFLYDPGLGFYGYEEQTGVWEPKTKEYLGALFSNDLKRLADQTDIPELLLKRKASLNSSLIGQLAGKVERRNAFAKKPQLIHLKNGMLRVEPDNVELLDFSPDRFSLGQIPINFDPDAKCPRFLKELLGHALPDNDILLLQKYAGQILLGTNISQTFLILEGEGGSGKGQIGVVIDQIIGVRNVAELRTAHLSGRFETKSYLGKHLLAGRDVPGDFLSQKGAAAIKKLTGGDLMTVESKGKDERSEMYGEFNIIITSNCRLILPVEGDKSAWKRRLLIIPFEREPVGKPIPNFGKVLVEEEGAGILAWMVKGAQLLLRDIQSFGKLHLDPTQRKRISRLLAESDSVMDFVTRRVEAAHSKCVFTDDLWRAYTDFCLNNDIPQISKKAFERKVKTELLDIHGAKNSENITRNGRRGRGYLGVRLRADHEDDLVKE